MRVISGIGEVEDARIDMAVEAVFDDASDDYTLVKFKPA